LDKVKVVDIPELMFLRTRDGVAIYKDDTCLLRGQEQGDGLKMAFQKDSCLNGELLFTVMHRGSNFRLEATGDVRMGTTLLGNCCIVLTESGTVIESAYELEAGTISVRFKPDQGYLKWTGILEFREPVACEISGDKHLDTRLSFQLPEKHSALQFNASKHFKEFDISSGSLEGSLEQLSSGELEKILEKLSDMLAVELLVNIHDSEDLYSNIELLSLEKNEYSPLNVIRHSNFPSHNFHTEGSGHKSSVPKPANAYIQNKDFLFERKNGFPETPDFSRGQAKGYFSDKKPMPQKSSYLGSASRSSVSGFANGYLEKSAGSSRHQFETSLPAAHTEHPHPDPGFKSPANFPQNKEEPLQLANLYVKYSEIEKCAERILSLKEVARAIMKLTFAGTR